MPRGQPRGALALAAPLLIAAAALPAQVPHPDGPDAPVFDTRRAPGFGDATPALRGYLRRARPRPRGAQHFCVVGYAHPDGRSALIHWRERRRLIAWHGSDPAYPEDALRWSRALDRATDVVATGADVAGSTYRVTRRWWSAVLADCAARGTRYAVAAPRR